ncbi:carboxylesterase/lipase family protein [Pigmentiphaga litoralis]|uniref:Carboxylic ester hydrolase n=1 Tax=Pigmentiphaga litoralis TaxID=516702 RepID=A0A7Y9ITJ1_9BURK|nr:carboxylesterase family protein [Pigmentiphaga litoralis]NYE24178.1 para-nitrobenzyl esterase [Pigmentiphaga litoralis]NYE82208.1 para-nitrobenzyl esterase [Pigmentiphaga litoralis]
MALAATAALVTGCGGSDDDSTSATPAGPVALNVNAVATDKGLVKGAVTQGVAQFKGIPYAAAPTGDLRWRAPQPRAAWTGTLDATVAGEPCTSNTTEDCLSLNVTVPYPVTRANMPVFVFVHGGGFSQGSGAGTDPTELVKTGNFVVVTLNYRLGIFGYLANFALDSGNGDTGNYGLMDQRAALRWVQTNINQFGGDPAKVTLGGNSAGGMSTCNHLASPASQGLFKQALVMSGPCAFNWDSLTQKLAAEAALPAQLGCTGTPTQVAACLRAPALPIASTRAAGAALPRSVLFPSVGGVDVPVQPRTALGKVPMLIGYNTFETGAGVANPANDAEYLTAITAIHGSTNAAAIAGAYPRTSYPTGTDAMKAVASDFNPTLGSPQISVCNNIRTFELRQTAGTAPLYAYEFADPASSPNGATHTAELKYVFPTATTPPPAASTTLSTEMIGYWANFINTGNPNGAGLATWPAYTSAASVLKLLPGATAPFDADAAHKCAFWKSLGLAL